MVTHLRNQAYVFSLVLRSHRRAECQHNIMSSPSKKQHQKATSRSSIKPTFTLQFLTRRYRTSWGLFGKSVVLYPPSRVTGSVVKNEAMLPPLSSLASASVHVLLLTPKQQPPTTNGYDGASPNYLTATTTTGYPPKHRTILRIASYNPTNSSILWRADWYALIASMTPRPIQLMTKNSKTTICRANR